MENYGRVRYQAVYPGIDLVYYGNGRQLEYDLVVAPGADPSRIQLSFPDVHQLHLDQESGNVELAEAGREVCLHKPVAYQVAEGQQRVAIEARYTLATVGNRVGLTLGRYDATQPLIIDPVLVYSTYIGGSGLDGGNGIAVDSQGNAYVTGVAVSPDFPLEHPLPTNSILRGFANAFVSKLSFDTRTATLVLAYSTYLGGSSNDFDYGNGIAVDSHGDTYVTGIAVSPDFPLVHPLPTNSGLRGGQDAFVSKLSFDARTATLSLTYSTYLGGSGFDVGYGIAVDSHDNAYVTGVTQSSDFPLAHPLSTNSILRGSANAFVSKLSFDARTTTLSLAYSTYLGGSGYDYGNGIAEDAWGNAYVTGHAQASDFPLAHPLSTNSILRGLGNAFVSKLSFDKRTSTLSMVYSTYLGGDAYDIGSGIAVDSWGNAYVTGRTQSSDFPLEHPLPTNSLLRGVENAFVSKLAFDTQTATLSLDYSTYLGGSFYDDGYSIAVDARGNAYVTGSATSSDFPLSHALPSNSALQGGGDASVSKLSFDARTATLSLAYSTYLGGSSFDFGSGIAVDTRGNAYVVGGTDSADFPLMHSLPTSVSRGSQSAFVVKIRTEPFGDKDRDVDDGHDVRDWEKTPAENGGDR